MNKRVWGKGGRVSAFSLLMVAVLVAACGSSNSGGNKPGGSSAGPIHIGISAPFTGQYAAFGASYLDGAKVAESLINKAGGIMGRKVVLDLIDTLGDPVDAVPAMRQEIALRHPAAIIGGTSIEDAAVLPILKAAGIPYITAAGDPSLDHNTYPWLWRVSPSDSQLVVAMALWATQRGYHKAAIVFQAAQPDPLIGGILASSFKRLGGQTTTSEYLAAGAASYGSEVARVISSHPQVVFFDGSSGEAIERVPVEYVLPHGKPGQAG